MHWFLELMKSWSKIQALWFKDKNITSMKLRPWFLGVTQLTQLLCLTSWTGETIMSKELSANLEAVLSWSWIEIRSQSSWEIQTPQTGEHFWVNIVVKARAWLKLMPFLSHMIFLRLKSIMRHILTVSLQEAQLCQTSLHQRNSSSQMTTRLSSVVVKILEIV